MQDKMLDSLSKWIAIVTSILALAGGTGWYSEHVKSQREAQEARERIIVDTLAPIELLLQTNEGIFKELRSSEYTESGWGIQESYLLKIRRDGTKKNSLMKQRIDTLVKNNQSIITLLQKYAGYTRTPDFRRESQAFVDHASLYNDRWNSLIEIFESGGNFPTGAPVFPEGFPPALRAEIHALKHDA